MKETKKFTIDDFKDVVVFLKYKKEIKRIVYNNGELEEWDNEINDYIGDVDQEFVNLDNIKDWYQEDVQRTEYGEAIGRALYGRRRFQSCTAVMKEGFDMSQYYGDVFENLIGI